MLDLIFRQRFHKRVGIFAFKVIAEPCAVYVVRMGEYVIDKLNTLRTLEICEFLSTYFSGFICIRDFAEELNSRDRNKSASFGAHFKFTHNFP